MKKLSKAAAFLMALSILMTGCATNEGSFDSSDSSSSVQTGTVSGNMTYSGATVTVEEIKNAYNYNADGQTEVMPLYNVSETESFTFKFNFNWYNSNVELYDLVSIHTQRDCLEDSKIYYNASVEENSDGTFTLTVAPMSPVLGTEYQEENYIKNEIDNWGNAPMYYISLNYDMESTEAKKLDKPTVIPFTVKHEVEAPNAKGVVNEQGRLKLEWEPVEGAEKYNIYKLTDGTPDTGKVNNPINGAALGYDGGNGNLHLLYDGTTTECSFDNFAGEGHGLAEVQRENGRYYCTGQNYCVNGEYYVTAVVNGVESGLSAAITTSELAIPHKVTEETDILFANFPSAADFPATVDVINIDGSVTKRNVIYDGPYVVDVYGYEVVQYNYTIEGTALAGYVIPEDEYSEHVSKLLAEQYDAGKAEPEDNIDKIPDNDVDTIIPTDDNTDISGEDLVDTQIENTQEHIENADSQTVSTAPKGVYVNAETAEEEWLALNLIEGKTEISLEAFPALQDPYYLVDVFNKVYYQNPYILGVYAYSYDYNTLTFKVEYVYDADTIKAKQDEITDKADEIVSSIITDGMTDEQKVKAIYEYLVANCVYDNDALANAEANNFVKDNSGEFEDAFNTYGTLINGKGVCMSYAYSFRILCDLAGVECKVVTGYLDGNLPHAWNTVKLGEEWYEVDATNNAVTTGIPYFLYQASEEIATATGYTKDDKFEIDEVAKSFGGDDSALEYYTQSGLTADSYDALVTEMCEGITADTQVFAVRWYGEQVDEAKLTDSISLAFNTLGIENKLETSGFVATNGFVVIIIK